MSKESIYAVAPKRAVFLLTDKYFSCLGQAVHLLSPQELKKRKSVLKSKLQTAEDQLNQHEVINRNIDQLVEILKRGYKFDLINYNDADLIFYSIDKFLTSQYELNYGNATPDRLEDYAALEQLANFVLEMMDFKKRATLPNVIEAPKTDKTDTDKASELQLVYNNLFKVKADTRNAKPAVNELTPEVSEDDLPKYNNPFKAKLATREVNTLMRFK